MHAVWSSGDVYHQVWSFECMYTLYLKAAHGFQLSVFAPFVPMLSSSICASSF